MTCIFAIEIGYDTETGVYQANVISTEENKGCKIQSASIKGVMAEVSKRVRKRTVHNRKFPPPEPSLIIAHDGNGAPHLIVPGRN